MLFFSYAFNTLLAVFFFFNTPFWSAFLLKVIQKYICIHYNTVFPAFNELHPQLLWGFWPTFPWLTHQNIKCKPAVDLMLSLSQGNRSRLLSGLNLERPVILPGISESRTTNIWAALLRAKEQRKRHILRGKDKNKVSNK